MLVTEVLTRQKPWHPKVVALEVQQKLIEIGCDSDSIKRAKTMSSAEGEIEGYSVFFLTKTGLHMMVHVPDDKDMEMCIFKQTDRERVPNEHNAGFNDTLSNGYDYTDDASYSKVNELIARIDQAYNR